MRNGRRLVLQSVVAGLILAVAGSTVGLGAQAQKKHDAPAKSTTSSKDSTSSGKTSTKTDTKTSTSTTVKPAASKVPTKADSKSAKQRYCAESTSQRTGVDSA